MSTTTKVLFLCTRNSARSQMVSWPVDDPASAEGPEEDRLRRFRAARDQIEQLVKDWVKSQATGDRGSGPAGA